MAQSEWQQLFVIMVDSDPVAWEVVLRRAEMSDVKPVFEWRNAPETRKFFSDPDPISWEGHISWFSQAIQSKDICFLIAEIKCKPVGVLRYDIMEHVAEVSIYLVPGNYGKGIGPALLRSGHHWIENNRLDVALIRAKVLSKNVASVKAFKKAGFVETVYTLEYSVHTKDL